MKIKLLKFISTNRLITLVTRQRYFRFGMRDRIARFIHNPDVAEPMLFDIKFYGQKYVGDFSVFLDWSTFYFGAYCIEELEFMAYSLKSISCPVVIDVGANIGHHSLFASTIASEVYAFEPFPDVANKITRKIQDNNLANLKVFYFGLGQVDELLPYNPPVDCNTGTGSFIGKNKSEKQLMLPIKNGDDFFQSNNINNISFIKIDVEGYEVDVLKGLAATILNERPIIFFEWSNYSIQKNLDMKFLFPNDFLFFDFYGDENKFCLFAIPKFHLSPFNCLIEGNKVAIPKEKAQHFFEYIDKK